MRRRNVTRLPFHDNRFLRSRKDCIKVAETLIQRILCFPFDCPPVCLQRLNESVANGLDAVPLPSRLAAFWIDREGAASHGPFASPDSGVYLFASTLPVFPRSHRRRDFSTVDTFTILMILAAKACRNATGSIPRARHTSQSSITSSLRSPRSYFDTND